MFPNLEAELKRRDISRMKIAQDFGLAISTVYARLSGKSPIPVSFAKKIKSAYKINVPLEELFEESSKSVRARVFRDSHNDELEEKA